MSMLVVKNVKKVYTTRFGGNKVTALQNVNLTVERGEFVAIMGESGSGKTTLLNIIATLDKPTEGEIELDGQSMQSMKEKHLAKFRRDRLGFVFQEFNLLDNFSVRDNIYLPLVLAGCSPAEMETRIRPIAEKLGITELLEKFPYEISGGQKQRVAVARAIITEPEMVLADEPTGALDSRSTDELLQQFSNINKDGQTILMVTHSIKAASTAGRVLFIKDGIVYHQIYRGDETNSEFYRKISDSLTALMGSGLRAANE
ncbi:MAG: ABC transporter ATP-binding protein [Clostridiales bacterium]|nr:ABC transporter ATP-binding protein [Clostridiales bacterium]MBR5416905.1 ABC transporter ATP-binding protein [Clostridiales bacterium]